MKMQDKIVINDYIENDPLSEENLDKTLETVNRFRLSFPNKTIWLYTGYAIQLNTEYIHEDDFWNEEDEKYSYFTTIPNSNLLSDLKRHKIISQCNVVVDGQYIDSQRDISLHWKGSSNQRVISIKESLEQNKIILYDK